MGAKFLIEPKTLSKAQITYEEYKFNQHKVFRKLTFLIFGWLDFYTSILLGCLRWTTWSFMSVYISC